MWQSFKNYFVTAQLIAGIAMAIKMGVEGWNDPVYGTFAQNLTSAAVWALGGFLIVLIITVPYALIRAALHQRRMKQLQL
jgi:hypothetical protein